MVSLGPLKKITFWKIYKLGLSLTHHLTAYIWQIIHITDSFLQTCTIILPKNLQWPPTHLENFQNIIFGGSRLPLNELGFLNCGIFDIQVNNKKSKQDECCCHSGWPTSLHPPILMHRPLLLLHAPLPLFLLPPNCPSTTPPPSFHQCQSASPPPQYPPCSSVLCPAVHTSSSTLFCIESNLRDKLINLTRDRFIQRQGQKCTWSSDFRQSADKLMNVEKE